MTAPVHLSSDVNGSRVLGHRLVLRISNSMTPWTCTDFDNSIYVDTLTLAKDLDDDFGNHMIVNDLALVKYLHEFIPCFVHCYFFADPLHEFTPCFVHCSFDVWTSVNLIRQIHPSTGMV